MRFIVSIIAVLLALVPTAGQGQNAVGVGLSNEGPTWTIEVTLVGEWVIEGEWYDAIGKNMDVMVHKVGESGMTRYRVTRDLAPGEWRVWVEQDGETLYMTAFIVRNDEVDIGEAATWAGDFYLPIITRGAAE